MPTATSAAVGGKRLISSDEVEGTSVYGADNKKIGSVNHLMIERVSGQVTYAVIDFGGFLGIGESHYPVPWSTLHYDTSLEGYKTNITKDQLESAPEYSDDSFSDRDWETRTYANYGSKPYWDNPSINR